MLKRFLLILVMVAAVYVPAAQAEKFFTADEEKGIREVSAELLPRVDVLFHTTVNGDLGILFGPTKDQKVMFIFVKRDGGSMYTYKPSRKYEWPVLQVAKAVHLTLTFWDAQRALGPGPKF